MKGVVKRNLKIESFKGFLTGGVDGADEDARGALSEVVGGGKGGLGGESRKMKGGGGANCSGEVGDGGLD